MATIILCSVVGCGKKIRAKGLCGAHERRLKEYGDPLAGPPIRRFGRLCDVEGCGRKHAAHGYCQTHKVRFLRYGSPTANHPKYRCNERWIEEHKDYRGDDCIEWPFHRNDTGRGVIGAGGGKARSAPRAMCIAAHGEPPTPDHETAHSCGNGHLGCMNPKHLRWATHMENVEDRAAHGRDRRGRQINTNKLSEDDVRYIRSRRGEQSGASLAREFGVTPANISSIQLRKVWAWLE